MLRCPGDETHDKFAQLAIQVPSFYRLMNAQKGVYEHDEDKHRILDYGDIICWVCGAKAIEVNEAL